MLVAILNPYGAKEAIAAYAEAGIDAFAMELMPRITRAQSMDVLSLQANLAGYRGGARGRGGVRPRLPDDDDGGRHRRRRRASSSWAPASPACRRSRRRGAWAPSSRATDVRPAAKEQVESLGATFVAVEDEEFKQAETAGGYAKEMSDDYQAKQAALIAETIKKQDIVITTALIPGRKAPVLVTEAMVQTHEAGLGHRRPGGRAGRQLPRSPKPGKVVEKHGVKIVGHANVPSRIAVDASALYARNLLNFLTLLIDKETKALKINWEDEIVKGVALTRDGAGASIRTFAGAEGTAMNARNSQQAAELRSRASRRRGRPLAGRDSMAASGASGRHASSFAASPSSCWPASSATTWSGG